MQKPTPSKNLYVTTATALLAGLFSSMTRTMWQPFVLSLGAPMSILGLLESLGGYRGVLTAPLQFLSGWLSDRRGRKPFILLGHGLGIVAMGLCLVATSTHDWHWLVPGVIFLGSTLMADPAKQSLVAESSRVARRGMAFSVFMVAWTAPGILAPAIGGFISDRWGFAPIFWMRLVLEGLCLLISLWLLRETLTQASSPVPVSELKGVLAKMVTPPSSLRGFYLTVGLDSFAWGIGGAILFGMLKETYHFSQLQLGLMAGLSSATWVLAQLPIGRWMDRYGCKPFLIISEGMGIPIVAGWLFSDSFLAFAVLHACFGLMAATWVPALRALLANSVPEHHRGEAMGRLAAFRGLVAFPAPFLGGWLHDQFGFDAPILANLIGVAVTLVLLAITVREPVPERAC